MRAAAALPREENIADALAAGRGCSRGDRRLPGPGRRAGPGCRAWRRIRAVCRRRRRDRRGRRAVRVPGGPARASIPATIAPFVVAPDRRGERAGPARCSRPANGSTRPRPGGSGLVHRVVDGMAALDAAVDETVGAIDPRRRRRRPCARPRRSPGRCAGSRTRPPMPTSPSGPPAQILAARRVPPGSGRRARCVRRAAAAGLGTRGRAPDVTARPRRSAGCTSRTAGEIARRIVATATRLGIEAVVPDLDAPGAVDLLDADAVAAAARAAGCRRRPPGLRVPRRVAAARPAVADAGLTWVGPPPEAIAALGDKAEARAIARRAGVPVADGAEPEDQSDASLVGGRGGHRLPGARQARRRAAAARGSGSWPTPPRCPRRSRARGARRPRAFDDPRLLLERYVADARHVEVQVLADTHGAVVHLGDRDCSLQRRHQKVLEEAPAPGLDDGVRRGLWDAAVRLARAAGLRERRHVRVPRGAGRLVRVPRAQRAAPGGAPGHGARAAAGPRRRPAGDRGRGDARVAGAGAGGDRGGAGGRGCRDRGAAQRRGPGGRVPAVDRAGRRGALARGRRGVRAGGGGGHPGRRGDRRRRRGHRALRPAAREGDRHRPRPGRRRWRGWRRPSTRPSCSACRRTSRSCAGWSGCRRWPRAARRRPRSRPTPRSAPPRPRRPSPATRRGPRRRGCWRTRRRRGLGRRRGGSTARAGSGSRPRRPARSLDPDAWTGATRGDARRSPRATATRPGSRSTAASVAFRLAATALARRDGRLVARPPACGPAELAAPMPGLVIGVHVRAGDAVAAGDRDRDPGGDEDGARGDGAGRRRGRGGPRARGPAGRARTPGRATGSRLVTDGGKGRVRVYEVGPRDGLQNEAGIIATADKRRFIEALLAAGLREIEATSFVRPDRIPQLADADELLPTLPRPDGVRYPVLVANRAGLDRAAAAGADAIAVFTAATDAFAERNIGMTVERSRSRPSRRSSPRPGRAAGGGAPTCRPPTAARTAAASTPPGPSRSRCGCSSSARTRCASGTRSGSGCRRRSRTLTGPGRRRPASRSSGSPSTSTTPAARRWPTSAPRSRRASARSTPRPAAPAAARTRPGAAGNLATEDLVYLLDGEGYEHGVDLPKLLEAARLIAALLGRPLASKVGQAAVALLPRRSRAPVPEGPSSGRDRSARDGRDGLRIPEPRRDRSAVADEPGSRRDGRRWPTGTAAPSADRGEPGRPSARPRRLGDRLDRGRVLQRRQVARVQPQPGRPRDPAHDLAAPRPRQVRHDDHRLRPDRLAHVGDDRGRDLRGELRRIRRRAVPAHDQHHRHLALERRRARRSPPRGPPPGARPRPPRAPPARPACPRP